MTSGTLTQLTVAMIATLCHEANRSYCRALGDLSQPPWEEAPEWQRESALAGVEFNLAHPDAPASASHESWLKEKEAAGWVHGKVKDPNKREHPCMVPFAERPREQQAKDHLFKGICAALGPLVTGGEWP